MLCCALLDQAGWHGAGALQVPHNVTLVGVAAALLVRAEPGRVRPACPARALPLAPTPRPLRRLRRRLLRCVHRLTPSASAHSATIPTSNRSAAMLGGMGQRLNKHQSFNHLLLDQSAYSTFSSPLSRAYTNSIKLSARQWSLCWCASAARLTSVCVSGECRVFGLRIEYPLPKYARGYNQYSCYPLTRCNVALYSTPNHTFSDTWS